MTDFDSQFWRRVRNQLHLQNLAYSFAGTISSRSVQERDELRTQLSVLQSSYDLLQRQSEEFGREREAVRSTTLKLTSELESLRSSHNVLTGQRDELARKCGDLGNAIEVARAEIKKIESDRDTLHGERDYFRRERDELWSVVQGEFAGQVERLKADNAALTDENRSLAARLQYDETTRTEISALQNERDELRKAVETARLEGAGHAHVQGELQRRLNSDQEELHTLRGERDAFRRERDELWSIVHGEAGTQMNALKADNDALRDENRMLVQRLQNEDLARTEIAALRDECNTLRQERDALWSLVHGEYAKRLELVSAENESLKRGNAVHVERLRQVEEDAENLSAVPYTVECPRFPAGFTGTLSPKDEANLHRHLEGLRRIYTSRADPRVRSAYMADMLCTFGRQMHFVDDRPFIEAFKSNLTNVADETRLWRLHTLLWAARSALQLDGDFAECGVFEGFGSAVLCDALNFSKVDKTLFLYDTFRGLDDGFSSPEERQAVRGAAFDRPNLYEDVVRRFSRYSNVKVIRGVVPTVLANQAPKQLAFVHIDMNAAKAEIGALEALFRRVVPGGIIVLSDFGRLSNVEQHLAERKWFARQKHSICELPTGQGIVLKS